MIETVRNSTAIMEHEEAEAEASRRQRVAQFASKPSGSGTFSFA